MSLLRSKEDLIHHYDDISKYAHEHNEPVYIADETGAAELVILSAENYDQLTSTFSLNQLLTTFAVGDVPGEKHPEVDVFAELEKLK